MVVRDMGDARLQSARPSGIPAIVLVFVALALVAGLALRLSYPNDIEFKADERWTFDEARAALAGGPWHWLGMPTSVGGLNPGLSLWAFIALAGIVGAETPPELARAVQALNCAALLALPLFAWRSVPERDREPWFWAAALWAVNPVAVIFERKIWPPSILPLFVVAMIAAWWHRRTVIGSFLFGLLAVLLAQVHLSVAFLAAAMALWALADDRSSLRWVALLAGAALGAIPALPWLFDWAASAGGAGRWRFPILSFWVRWFMQPFGFGAEYTLGVAHFREFLAGPAIGGVPTYLVALLHATLAALALMLYARAVNTLWRQGVPAPRGILLGMDSTGLLVRAALIGYGFLLTAVTIRGADSHRHYLIIVAPLMALWVARLAALGDGETLRRPGRLALAGLCVVGALMSAALLHYIHVTQIIKGEYGATWAAQQSGAAPKAPTLSFPPRR
jgi:hypothetical protein